MSEYARSLYRGVHNLSIEDKYPEVVRRLMLRETQYDWNRIEDELPDVEDELQLYRYKRD